MPINSSSSNDSILHPHLSFMDDLGFSGIKCFFIWPGILVYTMFNITNILLLLPLCIFILRLGLQQWRQRRSTSAATMMSHSDSFTYHMVIIELFGVLGCTLCCFGVFFDHGKTITVGFCLFGFTWYGQTFFHTLTCVERYLAVVHPITYRSLRGEKGIRIRNVSIGCVWLFCSGITCVVGFIDIFFFDFCIAIFCLIIISFCSLSVLCILIRPGPGEQGGDRQRVDQSKQRAFYTITAILGVLLLRFVCTLAWTFYKVVRGHHNCGLLVSEVWLNIPTSLLLPLLFLHRAGIFTCCQNNTR